MELKNISIFSLNSGMEYASKVCSYLDMPLGKHEERDFEDGEHKIRTLESVRNKEVFIVQSIHGNGSLGVNDMLVRLLFFISELKESGASKVTAIVPYMCYARKDRKTKLWDPVTTKYIAKLFESAGTDHVVCLDIHNLQAFQNAFRCYIDHLEAKKIFADYIVQEHPKEDLTIMSPDSGGMKRADAFREILNATLQPNVDIPLVFMEKKRSMDVVSGSVLVGNVKDKNILIIDDLISSGTTLTKAANTCKEAGAKKVWAFVTHGVFGENAHENLLEPALDRLIITDSLPVPDKMSPWLNNGKIKVLDTAQLIGECIKRVYSGDSVTDLMEIQF